MPKRAKELTALEVARLKRPGLHMVGGVAGLGLQVGSTPNARSWLLRYMLDGRRRDKGLGGYPEVSLAEARAAARVARAGVRQGHDPIAEARAARSAAEADRAASKTFADCAAAYIKAQEPGWRNLKHGAQWRATLATYAYPVIGNLLVQDIRPVHVHAILAPIWVTKHETATRVRSRIENVLDYAISSEYRHGPNPARLKANLDAMLPPSKRVSKVVHHAAVQVNALPALMAELKNAEGQGARALEFAILTAARSGEVRGASWSEIDLQRRVWTIPGERMKMGKEHRVALSSAAVQLLSSIPRHEGLIFPSRGGRPLSDMTLLAVLRRLRVDAVPHGMRATFRTWAAERTAVAREVVEAALAHQIKDKVEEAYQRSDLFHKRGELMEQWGAFCLSAHQI